MSPKSADTSIQAAAAKEPVKSSFSIRPGTRPAIRRASSTFQVTQGEIVNLAPALFSLLAERSLAERKENLDRIVRLARQANKLFSQITRAAPHLSMPMGAVIQALDDVILLEDASLEYREVHGPSEELIKGSPFAWMLDVDEPPHDPLLATLRDVVDETDSSYISHVDSSDWDRQITYRCCESDEEKSLREEIGDEDDAQRVIDGTLTKERAIRIKKLRDEAVDELSGDLAETAAEHEGESEGE